MRQIKGMLFLFGAFSLAGTSVIAARYVTGKLGTFTITCISLLFSIMCLIPFTGRKIVRVLRYLTGMDWAYLFFQSVFGVFLYRMFLLTGLLHTSSAEAGILTGTTPAITVLLSRFLLKERMNRRKIYGILCTVAGILLIQNLFSSASHFSMIHIAGNLLVICSSACESLFNSCSRLAVVKSASSAKETIPPIVQTVLVSAIAMLLCLIPAGFEKPFSRLAAADLHEWLALLWYGVFVTALAYIFWYSGIRRCNVSTAAAFSGMIPFTSLILSVLILREQATLQQWCGGMLIIISMVLIGCNEKKIPSKHQIP
jgi:drug/metabolite transporter (DMT)-like permease